MDEIEGRIRSWVDSVAADDDRRTTADDAIERSEQAGRHPGTTARKLAVALVAAAVVAVVGGLMVRGSWGDGDGSLQVASGPPTAPGSSTSDGDPRLLGVVEGDGTGITPLIATSRAELVEMWTSSGVAGDPPAVDFERHLVMALVAPRSACEIEALVDWLAVDPQIVSRSPQAVRFCPAHPVDAAEPVARPTTFLVVVERG